MALIRGCNPPVSHRVSTAVRRQARDTGPEGNINTTQTDHARHEPYLGEISAEQIDSVNNAIASLRSALPFLVSLVPDERRELPKLGPKTLGFDERCQAHMASHPALVPSFIDQAEIAKDRALRERMTGVVRDLVNLANSAEDTLLLISHEVYSADPAFYQNVRQAAKRGILNAQTILEDLSPRFPGRSSSAGNSASKVAAAATA